MNKLLETALYYRDLGIATIPVHWQQKKPLGAWEEYISELPSEEQLRIWFASRLNNIAVITGWSNLVIIDFDDLEKFEVWRTWANGIKAAQYVRRGTRIVYSARGAHVYIITAERTENAKYEGIDILAQRKYALMPPSIHPSGKQYRYLRESEIIRIDKLDDIFPAELKIEKATPSYTEPKLSSITIPASGDLWDKAESGYSEKSIVTEIRNRIRIESLFPDAERSSRAGWLVVRCPFHDDKMPSFWIDTNRQICGCYAGCTNRPLDIINLYARLYNIGNAEAIEQLRMKI
jgi:hypothetical protein